MKIFRMILKDLKDFEAAIKSYILIFLILPIVVAYVNSIVYQNTFNPDREITKCNVALVDLDKGEYTKNLVKVFNHDKLKKIINVKKYNNINQVKDKLENGDYSTAVIVPKDFSLKIEKGEKVQIKVLKAPSSGMESHIIYEVVKSYSDILNGKYAVMGSLAKNIKDLSQINKISEKIISQSVKIKSNNYIKTYNLEKKRVLDSKQYFFTAMVAAMSFFVCLIGVTSMIKEKEEGTIKRIQSTTFKMKNLYISKVLFAFFISISQIIIFIAISKVLGVNFGDHYLNLLVMVFLHAFVLTGIAAISMSIFKNRKVLTSTFVITSMVMAVLGGSMYPLKYSGKTAGEIAKFTLNYWIQKNYSNTITGRNLSESMTGIVILSFIGIVGIVFGRLKFKVD